MAPDGPTFDPMEWWRFVLRTAGSDDQRAIAERAHVDQSTVSRWKLGKNVPSPAKAVDFARSYGTPAVGALVAIGVLSADEARVRPAATPALVDIDDDALLEEVRERMRRGGSNAKPEPPRKTPGPGTPADELAGRRPTPQRKRDAARGRTRPAPPLDLTGEESQEVSDPDESL